MTFKFGIIAVLLTIKLPRAVTFPVVLPIEILATRPKLMLPIAVVKMPASPPLTANIPVLNVNDPAVEDIFPVIFALPLAIISPVTSTLVLLIVATILPVPVPPTMNFTALGILLVPITKLPPRTYKYPSSGVSALPKLLL